MRSWTAMIVGASPAGEIDGGLRGIPVQNQAILEYQQLTVLP
jgi:hypothetical protein